MKYWYTIYKTVEVPDKIKKSLRTCGDLEDYIKKECDIPDNEHITWWRDEDFSKGWNR